MIASLCYQILHHQSTKKDPSFERNLSALDSLGRGSVSYKDCSFEKLLSIFQTVMENLSDFYLILDALDECTDSQNLEENSPEADSNQRKAIGESHPVFTTLRAVRLETQSGSSSQNHRRFGLVRHSTLLRAANRKSEKVQRHRERSTQQDIRRGRRDISLGGHDACTTPRVILGWYSCTELNLSNPPKLKRRLHRGCLACSEKPTESIRKLDSF